MKNESIRTDNVFIDLQAQELKVQQYLAHTKAAIKLGREVGMSSPLDKSYYRQVEAAHLLGHQVSPHSCGKNKTDGFNPETSSYVEYKTIQVTENEIARLRKGDTLPNKSFTYSSATNTKNIERVQEEEHYIALVSKESGEFLIIRQVSSDEVQRQLNESQKQHLVTRQTRGDGDVTGTTASTLDVKIKVDMTLDDDNNVFVNPSLVPDVC